MTYECKICGKPAPEYGFSCREHYVCIDCGTRKALYNWGNDDDPGDYLEGGFRCFPCHKKHVDWIIANWAGDTCDTEEPVCPYCGTVGVGGTGGVEEGDVYYECGYCNNVYTLKKHVCIYYTTHKLGQIGKSLDW